MDREWRHRVARCALLTAVLVAALAGTVEASPLTTNYESWILFGRTSSGLYDPVDPYVIGGEEWVARLDPVNAVYRRSPSQGFIDVLLAEYPTTGGWSYASAVNELSDNSLIVHTYDVQGTPARVGAEFHVEYKPAGSDPTTNLHWIQVIYNNHSLRAGGGHGVIGNHVDVDAGQANPYYDDGGAANANHFYDFPGRLDADRRHFWYAELFLVQGPAIGAAPGLITFLGGVEWGWVNHPVPEPATITLLAMGAAGLAYRRLRQRF